MYKNHTTRKEPLDGGSSDRNQLIVLVLWLAGGLGFEPRLAESESAVLPLDDPPSAGLDRRGIGAPSDTITRYHTGAPLCRVPGATFRQPSARLCRPVWSTGRIGGARGLGRRGRDLAAQSRDLFVRRRCRGAGLRPDHLNDIASRLVIFSGVPVDPGIDRVVQCNGQERRRVLTARAARLTGRALRTRRPAGGSPQPI